MIDPSTYFPAGVIDFGRYQAFQNEDGNTIQVPIEYVNLTAAGQEAERQNFEKINAALEDRRAAFLARETANG